MDFREEAGSAAWTNPDAVVFWATAGLSAALWLLIPFA
jgi:hypothetical protein